jgi:hypothetical protein
VIREVEEGVWLCETQADVDEFVAAAFPGTTHGGKRDHVKPGDQMRYARMALTEEMPLVSKDGSERYTSGWLIAEIENYASPLRGRWRRH